MIRYDEYGFRHMDMEQAVSFVQDVLGVQFGQRDSSYAGIYYSCSVGPSGGYCIDEVGGEYELNMDYSPEYSSLLSVNHVPDMDGAREKLIGGRGEPVLLWTKVYTEDSVDRDDEEDDDDELPDDWTKHDECYGFRDMDLVQVTAFVEEVVADHYREREGLPPKRHDLTLGKHEKNYRAWLNVAGSQWHARAPEYGVIVALSNLPDMHSLRAKLTTGRSRGVFLRSNAWAIFPSGPETPARPPDGREPAEPPRRHDVYGFGDMPLEEALFLVGGTLGIPVWERDGSFPGVYDSPERCGRKSFDLDLSSGMAVWKVRYPDHRAILVITDLPDMDAVREKLTGGSGAATFLFSKTSEAFDWPWWLPRVAKAPRESSSSRVRNEDDDPSTENPILAVLRGPSIKLT